MDYDLTAARDNLAEVVDRALTEGPQRITRHGESVVVVSETQWSGTEAGAPQKVEAAVGEAKPDFIQHLLSIPIPEDFELPERHRRHRRDVDLDDR